jgi:hypothetical protein
MAVSGHRRYVASGVVALALALLAVPVGARAAWQGPTSPGASSVTVNGPPIPMAVTSPGHVVSVKFSGTTGQHVAIVLNSVSISGGCGEVLTLLSPSGTTVQMSNRCGTDWLGYLNLPSTGTYHITLKLDDSAATGQGTLWVSAGPVKVGTVTVNGSPASMSVSRVGQGVYETFSGTAGQHVAVVLNGVSTSTGSCETLTLLDPSGATLESADRCGTNAPGYVNLPSTGTYQINLQLDDPTATGAGSLWVSAGPRKVGTVAVNGSSTSMSVSRVGQGVYRTFSGTAGQHVAIVLNAVSGGCETLTLLGPSGATVQSADRCGTNWLGYLNLPSTGTYQVVLQFDDPSATGQGTLWVSAGAVSAGSLSVNGSSTSMGVSRVGLGVFETFSGTAGQHIAIVLNGISISGGCETLTLLDPSGATVQTADRCGTNWLGYLNLPSTGTYQIKLQLDDPSATGQGTLWVSAGPVKIGTVAVNGAAAAMSVSRVGRGVYRTFSGTAGQHITIALSGVSSTGFCGETLTLVSPSGATVQSADQCGSITLGPATLPSTGTYEVVMQLDDPTSTGLGSIKVTSS